MKTAFTDEDIEASKRWLAEWVRSFKVEANFPSAESFAPIVEATVKKPARDTSAMLDELLELRHRIRGLEK